MMWTSVGDFIDMGGYGLYVWGSYGLSLLLMVGEPLLAARRRRHALRDAAQAELWDEDPQDPPQHMPPATPAPRQTSTPARD